MNTLIFSFLIIGLMMWEMLCYSVGRSRLQCLKNISGHLTNQNVVCAKLFQAISVGIKAFTKKEVEYLLQYTDAVPFTKAEQKDVDEIAMHIKNYFNKDIMIDKVPCNSGIIALAYKATYDGKPVIVKIKRIGIKDSVSDGLMKMKTLVSLCKYIPWLKHLDIETIFEENLRDINAQCDFKNEVLNAISYKNNNKRLTYMKVPDVYPEITDLDSDVIVLERLDGMNISELPEDSKGVYGSILAKIAMKSLLYDGFYHGDLHVGNMLFLGSPEKPVIGVFDFGVMGRLSEDTMEGFYNFFKSACVDKDYEEASIVITKWLVTDPSIYDDLESIDKFNLQKELYKVVSDIFSGNTPIDVSITIRINPLLKQYGLALSREFSKIHMSMAVILGIAGELCGDTSAYMKDVNKAVKSLIGKDMMYNI